MVIEVIKQAAIEAVKAVLQAMVEAAGPTERNNATGLAQMEGPRNFLNGIKNISMTRSHDICDNERVPIIMN